MRKFHRILLPFTSLVVGRYVASKLNVKKIIVLWGIALSITDMGGSHTERHENMYPGMKHFLPGGILHESIPKWKLDELSTEKEFYKAVIDIFTICTMLDVIYRCRGNEEVYDCIKTNSENYLDFHKNLLLEYGIYDILNEHRQNLLSKYDSSWWRNLLNKIPIRFIKM